MSNEPGISLSSLSQIGQISVNVHDLARAAVIYKETPGLKDLFTPAEDGLLRLRWHSIDARDSEGRTSIIPVRFFISKSRTSSTRTKF
jgi:hypothetical protein